jgi:hypothetical protein
MRQIFLIVFLLGNWACHKKLAFIRMVDFKSQVKPFSENQEFHRWTFADKEVLIKFDNPLHSVVYLEAGNYNDYIGENAVRILYDNQLWWKPTEEQSGLHYFEVSFVQNNSKIKLKYNISVLKVNRFDNQLAYTDRAFTAQVNLDNFSDQLISYQLITAPEGLKISDSGALNWLPKLGQIGLHDVKIRVYDSTNDLNQVILNFGIMVEKSCVRRNVLGIFKDINNNDYPEDNEYLGEVISYRGTASATTNYNYFSASAHPLVGPMPEGLAEHIFFYEGPDGLTLNFYFNKDQGGSPSNSVKWEIITFGNNKNDRVLLSDDLGELILRSENENSRVYDGMYSYWSNSDGGVLGPFIGKSYKIVVHNLIAGDNEHVVFYSANGQALNLMQNTEGGPIPSSFVIQHKSVLECKL